MDENPASWLPSNLTAEDSKHWENLTEVVDPTYVFTPAGTTAKCALCVVLSATGAVGFLGNSLIFFFLSKKKSRNPIQSNRFMKNLSIYVRSLSLSDLLCCAVSLPLLCIQILLDVFQSGWPCKIVRYFNFVFPVITINNLIAISMEKYLSTRSFPRTFSFSTVRKMIICAWVLGLVVTVLSAAPFSGVRLDLNNTHYTVICRADKEFYSFRMGVFLVPIQYVLPSIFIMYFNICLLKTVWTRGRRQIGNAINSVFKAHHRAQRIKGTSLLVALTFAFIIPYSFYIGNRVYTEIAKPQRNFSTDYMIRYSSAGIAICTSVLNFIIYFAQMKDFRVFVKKVLCKGSNEINPPEMAGRETLRAYRLPVDSLDVSRMEGNAIELRL